MGINGLNRVAVLSDVHGNVPALAAVLKDIEGCDVDLVVSCGDLTWGAEPDRTVRMMAALGGRARFVRGNADRAVAELGSGARKVVRPREAWIMGRHSAASVEFVQSFVDGLALEIGGLGSVLFCHGSPYSDIELITPGVSAGRFAAAFAGAGDGIVVGGHTHVQFDVTVDGHRFVNPGSVGLPYHEGEPGTAYWALLGPGVELRRSAYDVAEAVDAGYASADPAAEVIERLLLHPPTPDDVERDARRRRYSD